MDCDETDGAEADEDEEADGVVPQTTKRRSPKDATDEADGGSSGGSRG